MPSLSGTGELPTEPGARGAAGAATGGRLAPGDLLADRFVVVRYISAGGMGEVYEVEDRQLQGVRLALKTILPHIAADPQMQKRFEREVLLARRVIHPNLCPIYDICNTRHNGAALTFLTMKLLAGETLSERLKRIGPMSVTDATPVVEQIGAGLAAAHDAGVLHRDIKTANIMLQGEGQNVHAVVMDFGLAHATVAENSATSLTAEGIAGTLGYLAPELMRGAPASKASDVFAFGVVVYKMLTGQIPNAAIDLKAKLVREPAVAALPADWQRLVLGCLETSPAKRFQDMREALGALQGLSKRRSASRGQLLSRRQMLALGGGAVAAAAAGMYVEWPRIENYLHPLPTKRFVVVLNWPPPAEAKIAPFISDAIDAIGGELARAEASDHNLFIIPKHLDSDGLDMGRLNEIRESLGANMILGATAVFLGRKLQLLLRIFDPVTSQTIRKGTITVNAQDLLLLPEKAVRAAAELLNLTNFQPDDERSKAGTSNQKAFDEFKAGEAAVGLPNDEGLSKAITNYQSAVNIDARYADAYAGLAKAYCRLSVIHRDPAALELARVNSQTAISLDPSSVSGHMARASSLQQSGDMGGALQEIKKALAVDPSNYQTLIWQADIYTELNRWQDAESALRRSINERPNQWLGFQQLGYLLNAEGRYLESLREFQAAFLAAPKSYLPLSNIGAVSLQLGKVDDARSACENSMKLQANALAAETLAAVMRILHKYPEAVSLAKQAIQLDPTDSTNLLELGDCLSQITGRQVEAKKAYSEALNLQNSQLENNPDFGPGVMLLALYQAKNGDLSAARASLQRADKLPSGDMDSQLYKVRILELIGQREDALKCVSQCLARGATQFQMKTMPDLDGLHV